MAILGQDIQVKLLKGNPSFSLKRNFSRNEWPTSKEKLHRDH